MTIDIVIAWLVVGGVVGGLADLFLHIRYGDYGFAYKSTNSELGASVPINIWAFIGLCVLSAFIGLSGAVGVQVILIGIQKFSDAPSVENKLLLLSVSVIAGFGARRLLPQIRDRLEEELLKTREESRDAAEDAQEAIEEARSARTQLRVLASLRADAPASERDSCIKFMTKELELDPTDRTNTIILGRLQRVSGDLSGAVDTLTRFLEAKNARRDNDYADVLYNRACYNTLRWAEDPKPALLTSVVSDLSLSFKISPANKEDAQSDEDFDPLRKNDEFRGLFE